MSVRLRRWFGVPPELLETDKFALMSDCAVRLYTYLCWMSDRKSSRQFEVAVKEAAKRAGMSVRSVTTARRNLCKLGLIVCERVSGGRVIYTLCDPLTGKPYLGDPRGKIVATPKAKQVAPGLVTESKIAWEPTFNVAMEDNDSETSFYFGHNASSTSKWVDVADYNPFDSR
jgi:hypothetical protein